MRKMTVAGMRGDCDVLACNLGVGECDRSRHGCDDERAAPHRPDWRCGPTLRGITQATPLGGCRDRPCRHGMRDEDAYPSTPQRLR